MRTRRLARIDFASVVVTLLMCGVSSAQYTANIQGVVTDASESPFSDELLDRYPVLEERGPDALGVVPFRRATLMEIR